MHTIMDLCFLCTKDYNCVLADEKIVSQVKYLLPEITIIKLGIPLRICSVCDGALCAFNKFKQSSVESSRRLEARIKGAQGPPLHTASPPVVDDSETSDAKLEKMEEIFIKEEYVEETPLDTNNAFLDPIAHLATISAEPQNQLHKDRVSQNSHLHTDTNADNIEEIYIKEEQIKETSEEREFYNNVVKEHITEDESATLNPSEEVWKRSSVDSEEDTERIQIKDSFTCSVCNMRFGYKHKLNRHMKIHSGVKDFQCEICAKSFTRKDYLTSHMKMHAGVKDFHCEVCGKSFMHKFHLTAHMKMHSGIKDFHCIICKKSFGHKSNLTAHMKYHTEDKKFKCENCGKLFMQKHHLISHMKIHTGRFKCHLCHEIFTKKSDFAKHVHVQT